MQNIHQFTVKNGQGSDVNLSQYQGKVLLIVNTASKCGFTPQYQELEALYQQYKESGLQILAFPCNQFGQQEPASDSEIQQFCQINYGVSFPVMAKVNVNGPDADPVFTYLKDQARGFLKTRSIKWNFTKFLVKKNGDVIKRYGATTKPSQLNQAIKDLL